MNPTDPYPVSLRADRPFDVVALGLNAVDHLYVVARHPDVDTKVRIEAASIDGGGQAATACVALRRLGTEHVRYVGKIGDDALGERSLAWLREAGVDTACVRIEPEASTQYAVILVERATGRRTIAWHRDPKLLWREGEIDEEAVTSGKLLLLDGHDVPASLRAARLARAAQIPVVLDADTVRDGTEELVRTVDFVVGSAKFPARLTGIRDPERALRALSAMTSAHLVATQGEDGAVALLGDRIYRAAAFPLDVVDTTGAGDVFHGAFLFGLLARWAVERILRFSNAAAALSCRKLGARSALPSLPEVLALLSGAAQPAPR